jgi:purine-cytosine permease-like protein
MAKKHQQKHKKKTEDHHQQKEKWNETELRLATGAGTIAAAFVLSQLTGIGIENFYGSFQRYGTGFLIMVALYLIIYVILYKKYKA